MPCGPENPDVAPDKGLTLLMPSAMSLGDDAGRSFITKTHNPPRGEGAKRKSENCDKHNGKKPFYAPLATDLPLALGKEITLDTSGPPLDHVKLWRKQRPKT